MWTWSDIGLLDLFHSPDTLLQTLLDIILKPLGLFSNQSQYRIVQSFFTTSFNIRVQFRQRPCICPIHTRCTHISCNFLFGNVNVSDPAPQILTQNLGNLQLSWSILWDP